MESQVKATFALLADNRVHNLVRKLSWDIHQAYHTGIDVCRLPPHVSLKQPFDISNLDALATYMAEFAASVNSFEVELTKLELVAANIDGMETGILWLNVQETDALRGLHNRLNQELTARFGSVPAAFDGADYHFHMTVAIGGVPIEAYRKIVNEFSDQLKALQFTIQELVMFVYDERYSLNAGYMTYMVLPFSKIRVL
jgi:2'-5' RNA ligase